MDQNLKDKNEMTINIKQEVFVIEDAVDLKKNIEKIETKLSEIRNESKNIKCKISNIVYGENLKLFYSNSKKLEMEKILAKFHTKIYSSIKRRTF